MGGQYEVENYFYESDGKALTFCGDQAVSIFSCQQTRLLHVVMDELLL